MLKVADESSGLLEAGVVRGHVAPRRFDVDFVKVMNVIQDIMKETELLERRIASRKVVETAGLR